MTLVTTGSGTLRVFERICEEMLQRLVGDESPQGRELTRGARELHSALLSWPTEPPAPAVRAAVISKVLEMHRSVMEYTTSRP